MSGDEAKAAGVAEDVTSSHVPGDDIPKRVGRSHVWSGLVGFFLTHPEIPAHIARAATLP